MGIRGGDYYVDATFGLGPSAEVLHHRLQSADRARRPFGNAMKLTFIGALSVALSTVAATRAQEASPLFGQWVNEARTVQVELYRCPQSGYGPICGRLVRLFEPKLPDGSPTDQESIRDFRNPDPALRDRPVIGAVVLWGFKLGADGRSYEDGRAYNADEGATYRTLEPSRLHRRAVARSHDDVGACSLTAVQSQALARRCMRLDVSQRPPPRCWTMA
jgi:hypothetical protein